MTVWQLIGLAMLGLMTVGFTYLCIKEEFLREIVSAFILAGIISAWLIVGINLVIGN